MRCIGSEVNVCPCSAVDETSSAFDHSDGEEEKESLLSEQAAAASEGGSEVQAPVSLAWSARRNKTTLELAWSARRKKTASERTLQHERSSGHPHTLPQDAAPSFGSVAWTQVEDDELLALKTGEASWAEISDQLPSRGLEELEERWSFLLGVAELRAGERHHTDLVAAPFRSMTCLFMTANGAFPQVLALFRN